MASNIPRKPQPARPGGAPRVAGPQDDASLSVADEAPASLVVRIAELEHEQQVALNRIEELTQAKVSVELALNRLRAQKEQSEQVRQNTEKLQEELKGLLQRKDDELENLRQKIEEIKLRTRHDIALYKAERDAALALVEEQKHLMPVMVVPARNRWLEYLAMGILAMLGFITMTLLVLL